MQESCSDRGRGSYRGFRAFLDRLGPVKVPDCGIYATGEASAGRWYTVRRALGCPLSPRLTRCPDGSPALWGAPVAAKRRSRASGAPHACDARDLESS